VEYRVNYSTYIGTSRGKECRKRGKTEKKEEIKGKGRRDWGKKEWQMKATNNQLTTHATLRNQPADAHLQMTWSVGQR
jgi:hypothetical protein